jgi:hypothetical protein
MKQICTLSLVLFSFAAFSQQREVSKNGTQPIPNNQKATSTQVADNPRTSGSSVQVRTSEPVVLPYNVDDKYMGRAAEFLGNLTVSELPADFPVYEKQWDLKTYNEVVTAFYHNHLDIVRENVRKKLELLQH